MKLAQKPRTRAQPSDTVDTLCGGVAHELNNLLAVILGEADLALMFGSINPPLRESFGTIKRASEQAAILTRQLMAFSRRELVEPTVFDLNELVVNAGNKLTHAMAENIALITGAAAADAWVLADRSLIEQVIHNLVTNAREAMPKGGRLTLETSNVSLDKTYLKIRPEVPSGEYVVLTVSDTGEGINAKVKAHMFEPLFTTKAVGSGTGLGLATCAEIVKLSGGHIAIHSEVGVGTVCKVYLPRVPPARGNA